MYECLTCTFLFMHFKMTSLHTIANVRRFTNLIMPKNWCNLTTQVSVKVTIQNFSRNYDERSVVTSFKWDEVSLDNFNSNFSIYVMWLLLLLLFLSSLNFLLLFLFFSLLTIIILLIFLTFTLFVSLK